MNTIRERGNTGSLNSIDKDLASPLLKKTNGTSQLDVTNKSRTISIEEQTPTEPAPPASSRVKCVDAIRGLTIFCMILVNNAGQSWAFLNHSKWNGVTLADFVMPHFLFIVGTSIAFSVEGLKKRNVSDWEIYQKALIRTAKLLALGVLVVNFTFPQQEMKYWRFPGVLQRIAFCYIVVVTVAVFVPKLKFVYRPLTVVTLYGAHWVIAVAIYSVYLILMYAWNVPGCGIGHTGMSCNAAAYIDEKVFGTHHMYLWPTCYPECPHFDPEGLLTTIGATMSTFLGLYYGYIFLHHSKPVARLCQMLPLGLVLFSVGLILNYESGVAFNKNLYSFSFMIFMAGCAAIFTALCYVVIDILNQDKIVFPFIMMGMNSITLYIGSEVFPRWPLVMLLWDGVTLWEKIVDKQNEVEGFFWALFNACLYMFVGWIMYRKKIFIKL